MEKTRVEKNNTEQKGIEQINEVSLKRNRIDKNIIEQTKKHNQKRIDQIEQNRKVCKSLEQTKEEQNNKNQRGINRLEYNRLKQKNREEQNRLEYNRLK